ncbi:N-glycosylase/DNA lyase [Candidatus Woesearchaeota archaeon]|nr:N-glycosylase/DNA lyase [Candidatus Woesearchaeota archaeon]
MENYEKYKEEIKKRLKEFKEVKGKDLFYELCFCILTPQSKAFNADYCIKELKKNNFLETSYDPKEVLKKKIRFHNNKTEYLIKSKEKFNEFLKVKNKLNNEELREWLIKNIKGLGYKESSHFLRNIGYENLAILDRHILKNLNKHNVISEIPRSLTKKKYLEIEIKFKEFASKVKIPMDELDLLFWAQQTGKVFK